MREFEHSRLFQFSEEREAMACQIVGVSAAERDLGGVRIVGTIVDPDTNTATGVRMFVLMTREDAAKIAMELTAAAKAGGWSLQN